MVPKLRTLDHTVGRSVGKLVGIKEEVRFLAEEIRKNNFAVSGFVLSLAGLYLRGIR